MGQYDNVSTGEGEVVRTQSCALAHEMTFCVHPESIRHAAYLSFWFMCGFAFLVSTLWVEVDLSKSVLMETFGFNNMCVYWDYSPSREYTALVYPLFEYCFLAYVVLSFLQIVAQYKSGTVPRWFYLLTCVEFPFVVVFIAWFRMIFIVKVTDDAKGHTLGFFGMQIALCLVALQNVIYTTAMGTAYPGIGRKGTVLICWTCFFCLVPLTIFKMTWASAIFMGTPIAYFDPPEGQFIVQIVDRVWMLFAAVWPIIDAEFQKRIEPRVIISLVSEGVQNVGTGDGA
jgi:hypothetical protein